MSHVTLRISEEERAALLTAAGEAGMSLSDWLRRQLGMKTGVARRSDRDPIDEGPSAAGSQVASSRPELRQRHATGVRSMRAGVDGGEGKEVKTANGATARTRCSHGSKVPVKYGVCTACGLPRG